MSWENTVPPEAQEYLRQWKAMNRGADPRGAIHDAPDCLYCRDTGSDMHGDTCRHCCPHDEHDHGICLDCGRDIMDDLVAAAEFRADCEADR